VIGNSEPKLIDGVLIAPFAVGMTRPSRISGRDPVYTQEAREAKVEGFALVRCVIEIDGFVTHCEIVKAMPFMSDEILGAVKTWRFTPALRDGHPVRVLYTIPIRLRLS
jgi:protein TonB